MLNPSRPDSLAQHGLYITKIIPFLDERIRPLYQTLAELNLKLAMELNPSFAQYPGYAFALAELYQEKGDLKSADLVLRKIGKAGYIDIPTSIRNISLYFQYGRHLTAIDLWEKLLSREGISP